MKRFHPRPSPYYVWRPRGYTAEDLRAARRVVNEINDGFGCGGRTHAGVSKTKGAA